MVLISLVSMLNLLHFYISTFRSMCAVPNMTVFWSSLTSCFPGMLLTFTITTTITTTTTTIAIEFSLGGSSPYTSTDKTNKNK
jgi:ABC-type phosphate/phosphonate transport system permease subunit